MYRIKGILCEHCGKFLDFSDGLEEATAVGCLYCRETVLVSEDRMIRLNVAGSELLNAQEFIQRELAKLYYDGLSDEDLERRISDE